MNRFSIREGHKKTYLYAWRQLAKRIYLLKKALKKEMRRDLMRILHLRRGNESDKD